MKFEDVVVGMKVLYRDEDGISFFKVKTKRPKGGRITCESITDGHRLTCPAEHFELFDSKRFDLEKDFQKFLKSSFDNLRFEYYCRRYNREDAMILQNMLEERLGLSDPEGEIPEESWRQPNLCSE
jgi:hypothetical protein